MTLIFACIEILIAGYCLTMGTVFYRREHGSFHIKFIVLLMSISVFLTCIGYALMSIWPNISQAYILRNIGAFGIDLYLVCIVFFVILDLQFNKHIIMLVHGAVSILTAIDLLVFLHPNANSYIKYEHYNAYIIHEIPRHIFHYFYELILIVMVISFGCIWYKRAKYKRERRVLGYLFAANIAVILGFVLDYLFSGLVPSNPSFVFCSFISMAFFVFYRACNHNNIQTITINNVQNDIFSIANIALLAYNYNQELVLVSPYAKKIFNISDNEKPLPNELFDISARFSERLFETCTDDGVYNYKLRSKDGLSTFSVTCQAKLDSYNDPIILIITANDVTKEDDLVSKAYEASRAKTRFLAQMSHEIRTPINTILGMNEMINRETNEISTRQYSQDINIAGKQLLAIINDILDMSKIENNKLEIIPTEYKLVDLINSITRLATPLAQNKGLDLFLSTDASLPSVLFGDDTRITQILTNLISNAVKYTDSGSVSVTIKNKGAENENIHIYVEIKDTGMGISEEDIPKLFESFTRLNEGLTKHIEGTGLGIPIVNSLLEMMGSSLEVQSKVNVGSTFSFELVQGIVDPTPIRDIKVKDIQKPSDSTKHVYSEDAKVLIVDDNKMNLKVLQLLLKRNGIKPDMALTGMGAIEFAKNNTYHIIFMDHMMPEMDGIETLHKMRNNNLLSESTIVIALTANAIEGAKDMYLDSGFNDYMAKPINITELETTLGKYLPDDIVEYRTNVGNISFEDELDDDFF